MNLLLEEIQPGWTVIAADGEELGSVIGLEREVIRIKRGGLLGGEPRAPLDTVTEIETGRIELKVTRQQLT